MKSLDLPSSPETGRADRASSYGEARAAVASAAGLYLVGAALTATAPLLPRVSSPAGVAAIAATAVLTAAILLIAVRRWHGGLALTHDPRRRGRSLDTCCSGPRESSLRMRAWDR